MPGHLKAVELKCGIKGDGDGEWMAADATG